MAAAVWLVAAVLVIAIVWKRRTQARRGAIGSAAIGSIYDMLNEDKRNAVEIIVEERAAARDPEPRWQPARSQQAPPLAPRPAALQPAEPGR